MWGPGLLGPLLLLLVSSGCRGLQFHLPPHSRKCLHEELHRDVMVTGEYEVSEAAAPGIKTDLRVRKRHPLASPSLPPWRPVVAAAPPSPQKNQN